MENDLSGFIGKEYSRLNDDELAEVKNDLNQIQGFSHFGSTFDIKKHYFNAMFNLYNLIIAYKIYIEFNGSTYKIANIEFDLDTTLFKND